MKIMSRPAVDFGSRFQAFFAEAAVLRSPLEAIRLVDAFCIGAGATITALSIDDRSDPRKTFCTITVEIDDAVITTTGEALAIWG